MKEDQFFEKLLATFQVEAEEHLQALSKGLLALEGTLSSEQRQETLVTIFREAHSLKGAARAVNEYAIQEICQVLEDVLSAWKNETIQPSETLFDTLYRTLDTVGRALKERIEQSQVLSTTQDLQSLLSARNPSPLPPKPLIPLEATQPQIEQLIQSESCERPSAPLSKAATAEIYREKTVRIAVAKLDKLFQEAEEMLMVKLVTHQTIGELRNLLAQFKSSEKELGRVLTDHRNDRSLIEERPLSLRERQAMEATFDFLNRHQQNLKELRGSLTQLERSLTQNSYFFGSLVDSLLEDVKRVLMQPLSTLFESMPRVIRDLARDLKKEIVLETHGGDIEIDRRILEEIKDPIIHIIRNAADHGIEPTDERLRYGKSKVGLIRMSASETGAGNIELLISDDGRGFNLEKIKQAALKQSLLNAEEINTLTDQEVIRLAFSSGISTSSSVTQLSGRGLGLGIVSEKADALGGHVLIESVAQQGATFRLILPSTLATFRGIYITAEGQDFIMPAHSVKRVIRLVPEMIQTLENYETVVVDERPISFVSLANLLNLQSRERSTIEKGSLFALVVKSEEKVIAFGVDAIHREHEVLVKNLGYPCVRVRNMMAATIMEGGKVIPILNPSDLVRSAIRGNISKADRENRSQEPPKKKRILVVEDSITTRLLLKNILDSAGYEVATAADGLEAFEYLQVQPVDLLLTDIEMPRMDGFVLTEKVRAMQSLQYLPIVICTSRGSQEDRERGIELGANAYLDKSSFSQVALLSTTKMLL